MRNLLISLALIVTGSSVWAADKLIIISPHRKSIQDEFVPAFKKHYKATYKTNVDVEWIDQGGTSDDIRFIRSKFARTPKSSEIDIFWGGGLATFLELDRDGFLATYKLPPDLKKQIPQVVAGVPLYNKDQSWYASAMSSFGILYNKRLKELEGKPEPKTWQDLANPKFKEDLSLTDPRRSGTASTMNTIILQSMGWEKGWLLLTEIAGNTRKFTHSSSDPIKAIVSGDAAASTVIDFYAMAKVQELGENNLGFVLPEGQTVLDPDPIAILKGAPNRKTAERFVNFVLSPEAQKLLVLPLGLTDGPQMSYLGRMAINPKTYELTEGRRVIEFNPFKAKAFLQMDIEKAAKTQQIFNDLIGAVIVDVHSDLKNAWDAILKRGLQADDLKKFGEVPVTEVELLKLSEKWSDNVFRNRTINSWVKFAKSKYQSLIKNS